jgi:hypothetical protein
MGVISSNGICNNLDSYMPCEAMALSPKQLTFTFRVHLICKAVKSILGLISLGLNMHLCTLQPIMGSTCTIIHVVSNETHSTLCTCGFISSFLQHLFIEIQYIQ